MISERNKHFLLITGVLSILFITFYVWLMPRFDVSDINKNIYSLDIQSSYNKEIVVQLFNQISDPGIIQYRKYLLVDTVYLFIYGSLAFYLLQFLLNNMGRLANRLIFTIWTPSILMLLDIIENINTFFLLRNTSDLSDIAIEFGSSVTTLKWFAASVVCGMIICYAFYAILRNIFWKLKKNESTSSK